MKRLKTFFKYFLAIVIVYIVVDITSLYILKSTYNTKEYSVDNSIFDINVTEAKATFANGYIKGSVKNNTNAQIDNKYLKIENISKRGVLLGTKYFKLPSLMPGNEVTFSSSSNLEQIDKIKVSVIDKGELPPEEELNFGFDNPDDAKVTGALIFGAFIMLLSNGLFGAFI